jgi:tetratricopeptide (TPR) repeat protein
LIGAVWLERARKGDPKDPGQRAELDRAVAEITESLRALDDNLERAAAHNNLGNALSFRGDQTAALASYSEAIRDYERSGKRTLAASVRVNAHYPLMILGRFDDARKYLRAARDIYERKGKPKTVQSVTQLLDMVDVFEANSQTTL